MLLAIGSEGLKVTLFLDFMALIASLQGAFFFSPSSPALLRLITSLSLLHEAQAGDVVADLQPA